MGFNVNEIAQRIDWDKFKEFVKIRSSNKKHVNNIVNYSKKYWKLLFANPLDFALEIKKLSEEKKSLKRHILQALAAFSRYLDLVYDTDQFYNRFVQLRKKSGITWSEEKIPQIMGRQIDKDKIIDIVASMGNKKLKATSMIHLLTGLRTGEVFYLIKNFDKLKKIEVLDGLVVELGYVRKTKKAFLTILHKNAIPLLKVCYKDKKSYWNGLKNYGIKSYDFRRIFESLYSNLRSHEIDLLQGRTTTELTLHYTRNIENIASKILPIQQKLIEKLWKE
ncbi:MAG: hypothetical protein J7K83_03135 [Candidatus Aenigmarchaeota archaeon]|nr:hypothetical protein [Candidatus Aenigmarchaeota archaeon]